ncbi:MAG: S8 family serine peptidase [Firmicutes bacterium]|nr:S8 family serine peptidase [Bacillota bacterium]
MNLLIIDSGITADHKSFSNFTFLPTGFMGQNDVSSLIDNNGHGTAIADLILKNHQDVTVYILKLFDNESESDISSLIEALKFIKNGHNMYQLINMSFGFTKFEHPSQVKELVYLCDEIARQGSILVSAFDNDGSISYPACFDSVIGVDMSNTVRNKYEVEFIENSIINIKGFGANQKAAWKDPPYTIVRGTSFACANVSNLIISLLQQGKDVKQGLQEAAVVKKVFKKGFCLPAQPDWLKNSNAILIPFNKEIHSLVAYENMLSFSIKGVYDLKFFGRIGRKVSEFLDYTNVSPITIKNYKDIPWDSADFDTVIAGHLGELSWRCKRDLLEEIYLKCKQHHKKIYSFDSLNAYESRPENNDQAVESFWPYINFQHVPKGRYGKLYEIVSPVLAVIGTSSRQGKFTLQLNIRKKMQNLGYKVGQIGSEPSSLCFGMDFVYPYGYQSTVNLSGFESIVLLNQMIHELDMKEVDICIVGTQSASVPYSNNNLSTIPLPQVEFLLGTNPDAFILCVNPHDDIEYIKRTLYGVESYFSSKCLAIVIFPLSYKQMVGGFYKQVSMIGADEYISFKQDLSKKVSAQVFDFSEACQTDKLVECIIDYFQNAG